MLQAGPTASSGNASQATLRLGPNPDWIAKTYRKRLPENLLFPPIIDQRSENWRTKAMAAQAAPSTYTSGNTPPLTILVRFSLHHYNTATIPLLAFSKWEMPRRERLRRSTAAVLNLGTEVSPVI